MGGLFIILAGMLWAFDTLIRYPLLGEVSPAAIVFIEHFFLVLIFMPYFLKNWFIFFEMKLSAYFYFFIIGMLGSGVGTLAFTKAFSLINPSAVILLQKLQPVVAISLSYLILNEKIKNEFLIYAFVSLLGAVFISFPDLAQQDMLLVIEKYFNQQSYTGYLYTLLAVFVWGASTVFGKKLTQEGLDSKQIMAGRFTMGFVFMSIYLSSTHSWSQFQTIALSVYPKVFLMVILAGILGMYFYYQGLKKVSAKVCALLELFFPLFACAINWIFLKQELGTMQIVGAIMLTLSSAMISWRKL